MDLSENIKNRRRELKLSQEYVAERLGISRQAVAKWEAGRSAPTASNLAALAQVLELELSQLTAPGGCAEEERKQEAQSREARRNAKMLLGRWSGYLLANTGWDGYLGLTSTLEAPYYWLGITAAGIALLFLTSLDMRRRTRSSGGQLALETLLVLCIFCGKGLIPPLPHGLHVLLGELPVIACMAVLHLRYWRRIWVLPETASRRPKKRRRDRTDA